MILVSLWMVPLFTYRLSLMILSTSTGCSVLVAMALSSGVVGLKENVIIGKLIPAGTGMKRYKNIAVQKIEE